MKERRKIKEEEGRGEHGEEKEKDSVRELKSTRADT